jgi:hypothetical protein
VRGFMCKYPLDRRDACPTARLSSSQADYKITIRGRDTAVPAVPLAIFIILCPPQADGCFI